MQSETRQALAAGPLTARFCDYVAAGAAAYQREYTDQSWEACLRGMLLPAEALHVKRVQLTLPPTTGWVQAFDLIRQHGS